MGSNTKISWTHHSFNTHWGCVEAGPGCAFCYARTFSKRLGLDLWGKNAPRRFFDDKHWKQPLTWNAKAKKEGTRFRVFCASMADVFEDRRDLDKIRNRLWDLTLNTPSLDWQILTKRPENILKMVPSIWRDQWPMNVWPGTTAENQEWANRRIPHLLEIPAAVRFLSAEPLIDQVYLQDWMSRNGGGLSWVIVGGESGPKARPMDLSWARLIVESCRAFRVPVFVKQLGARPMENNIPLRLKDRKGGDPAEWPEDLRVREFPEKITDRLRFSEKEA